MNRFFYLGIIAVFLACQNSDSLQEGTMEETKGYYQEQHRPQFHFTPEANWMNDPNGMVYYDGEYHLFYQYYPYGDVWGPMHWGHAISKDLVTWEHLPIALYPDSTGMIFSGGAVVDKANTAGFKTGEDDPLIAFFTYHNMIGEKSGEQDFQTQAIAYSNDKGRSWTKYQGNPVVPNPGIKDFRDPKVFWHEASKRWIMIFAAKDQIRLYNSSNLKDWTFTSVFGAKEGSHGGVWECPDLFPLPIDGNLDQQKWVMLVSIGNGGPNGGSGTQYFIGEFDGKTFTNDNPPNQLLWLDYGKENYAGVSWSDIPQTDGRRLFIGWMSNWQYARLLPTSPWRSAMTIPRTLSLRNTATGLRLFSNPVKEFEALRTKSRELSAKTITGFESHEDGHDFDPASLELELIYNLNQTDSKSFGIELSNDLGERVRIRYEQDSRLFVIDRTHSGKTSFSKDFIELHYGLRTAQNELLKLHLFFDNSSLELFADDGETVMTEIFFPNENYNQLKLFAEDGTADLVSGQIHQLKSIWID